VSVGSPAGQSGTAAAKPAAGGAVAPAGEPTGRIPGGWVAVVARYGPIVAPVALMIGLGLWGLTRDSSMGNDEVATRWAALLSLHELAHLLRHVDGVHGLYYLLMHFWTVVGSTPTVLRIPSVIAMVIAVALTAVLARRLTGSGWAGLFAGLIMALTPSISYYAQTARSYAMVLACVVAATLVLTQALSCEAADDRRRATRWWVIYAALIALGGYLNEMSLLVLAAHAVTVLLARYGRRSLTRWLTASAIGTALVLPLVALSVRQHAAVSWIGRPGLAALRTLFHDYLGPSTAVGILLLLVAVLAVLPAEGAPWWRAGGVSLSSVALPLVVLPAFILLVESRLLPPLYVDRYVLYGEAGAALLVGAGVYRAGQWLARAGHWREFVVVPGAVVCVLALLLQLGAQHRIRTPQSRAYDFGGASRLVAAHARQGDGVLYFGTLFRKAELGYPTDFAKVTDFGVAQTPLQAGTFRGTDKTFGQTLPLMLNYQRIWVIGLKPSAALPAGLLREESVALQDHYSLILNRRFKGMDVTLWQRG